MARRKKTSISAAQRLRNVQAVKDWRARKRLDTEWRRKESKRVASYKKTKEQMTIQELQAYNRYSRKLQKRLRDEKRAKRLTEAAASVATESDSQRRSKRVQLVPASSSELPVRKRRLVVRMNFNCRDTSSIPNSSCPTRAHAVSNEWPDSAVHAPTRTTDESERPSIPGTTTPAKSGAQSDITGTPQMDTPQKEAVEMLRRAGVSVENESLIKEIGAYKVIVSGVRGAPSKTKSQLFSPKSRRWGYAAKISKLININRKRLYNRKQSVRLCKERKKKLETDVVAFLERGENSYRLPDKKNNNVFALINTMAALYNNFMSEHPHCKMSQAKFNSLRPKRIKLIQSTDRQQCLCALCENARLMLRAIGETPSLSKFAADHPSEKLEESLPPLMKSDAVRYIRWARKEKYDAQTKKTIFRVVPEEVLLEKPDFVEEFCKRFRILEEHTRRFRNQYQMVRHLRNNLGEDEITCHMDFAENYRCCYQREPSQTYYDKHFLTVHPFVIHQKEGKSLVSHSYCAVSDDLTHTFPAVLAFLKELIPMLKKNHPDLRCLHFISDGPVTQYRNRFAAAALSKFYSLFNVSASWQFLEAGHGKGPCDGVGGAVKRGADLAVKKGTSIKNAKEFVAWGETSDSRVKFFEVRSKNIKDAIREVQRWTAPPLTGISKVHSIVPYQSTLYTREMSCFQVCCRKASRFEPTCPGWKSSGLPTDAPKDAPHAIEEKDDGFMQEESAQEHAVHVARTQGTPMLSKNKVETMSSTPPKKKYLRPPFLKIDQQGFRPQVKILTKFPMIDFQEVNERGSPFVPKKKSREKPALTSKAAPAAHKGFCEICELFYQSAWQQHCQTEDHLKCVRALDKDYIRIEDHIPPDWNNNYNIGDFCAALYEEHWYAGRIKEVEGNESFISFLTEVSKNRYKWLRRDELWVKPQDILCHLSQPKSTQKRSGILSFKEEEILKVESIMAQRQFPN